MRLRDSMFECLGSGRGTRLFAGCLALVAAFGLVSAAQAVETRLSPPGLPIVIGPASQSTVVTWPHPFPAPTDGSEVLVDTCTPASGTTFFIGETTVRCERATRNPATGQSSSGWSDYVVKVVRDWEGPAFVHVPPIRATASTKRGERIQFPMPRADDISGVAEPSRSCDPASGTEFPRGITTVTCSASDTWGNASTITFRVVVVPSRRPSHRDDVLRGTARRDVIRAWKGDDVVSSLGGNDIVDGGDGNDLVNGGAGDDRLTGGRGRDRLFGGPGGDTLLGVDGERDVVDCGPGRRDVAIVDRIDRTIGCERRIERRPSRR